MQKSNLHQIDEDKTSCRNLINTICDDNYLVPKRIELEQKVLDLEQEKRKQQVDAFRDLFQLKRELREAVIEELEEKQKYDLFFKSAGTVTLKDDNTPYPVPAREYPECS